MTVQKVIKVGIMPFKQYQQYTIAIAAGQYKPAKDDPKIWFESIEACMQVLCSKNIELLKLIDQQKPKSIQALADISGRKKSNLSRTLKTFKRYNLVEFIEQDRKKRPVALATQFDIQIGRGIPDYWCADLLSARMSDA